MAVAVPNLFLVGAMRAGTTALHEALGAHPECFMSDFKEPAFFAPPSQLATDSPVVAEADFAGNPSRYLDLFANAGDATYLGESSTHYAKLPRITGVPERMASMAPDARIIYIVRNPVERTLSHYRYAVRKKYERRPCLEALQDEPIYCAVSDYARQIKPYLEVFGAEQVYVCVLEEMASDPDTELDRLFEWLGLQPAERVRFKDRNALAPRVHRTRGPDLIHRVSRSAFYRSRVRPSIPEPVVSLVRRGFHRPISREDLSVPQVMDYLWDIHEPQIEAFEQLAGRTFEVWKQP